MKLQKWDKFYCLTLFFQKKIIHKFGNLHLAGLQFFDTGSDLPEQTFWTWRLNQFWVWHVCVEGPIK